MVLYFDLARRCAARPDSHVHERDEVHRHADDRRRPDCDHGVPGRRGPVRLISPTIAPPSARSSDPDLAATTRTPTASRTPRSRQRVRTGRRRVQRLQHRSPARGAADGGHDAVDRCREQKTLIYFASGLRLNGADNQAQLRATVNAAIRVERDDQSDRRPWPGRDARRSATPRSASPGGIGMFNGQIAADRRRPNTSDRRTRYYALAKDTGGEGDVRLQRPFARHRAGRAGRQRLLHRSATTARHDAKRRQVPARQGHVERRVAADLAYRAGYFADKDFGKFNAPTRSGSSRKRFDARGSGHRHHDRDGSELLPAQPRRVLRADCSADARQRAGAAAAGRRATLDRLHRRDQGRLRRHASGTCATRWRSS